MTGTAHAIRRRKSIHEKNFSSDSLQRPIEPPVSLPHTYSERLSSHKIVAKFEMIL